MITDRAHSSRSCSVAVVAAVMLLVQVLLPVLHTRHLASHVSGDSRHIATCCQGHHHHDQAPADDGDDDQSCPTCLTFAVAKQADFTPVASLVSLIHGESSTALAAPGRSHRHAADLTARSPRGPPSI
jgi:hypothetical protein